MIFEDALSREMDQEEAMEMARRTDADERAKTSPLLADLLLNGPESYSLQTVRASQFAAAWLPETGALLVSALRAPGNERAFAILCSLTDVDRDTLMRVSKLLVPAVLDAVAYSNQGNGEVAYIAAKLLRMLDPGVVLASLENISESKFSRFFFTELRRDE